MQVSLGIFITSAVASTAIGGAIAATPIIAVRVVAGALFSIGKNIFEK